MDDLFCVTLNNMTKQDARFYCRTYGLVYRPNRNNGRGFDLAGDEDSVREMLEDYIGRYDEIGKIMNEGNYVPDYDQDDFIDHNKSMLRRVGDSSTPIEDLLIKTDNRSGITLDHAIDDLKKRKGYNDSLLGDNLAINMLMKRFNLEKRDVIRVLNYKFDGRYLKDKKAKTKDSDPWHELAHYELTYDDGSKENDTIPIYVKRDMSDEELIEYFQGYHPEDKIVSVKQVGWSRMGDSKKKKVKDSEDITWRFVLNKRRNYYDEYVVKAYKNGKYYEDATYYTDDWDDAVATLKFEAKRQGLTITVDTSTRVVAE